MSNLSRAMTGSEIARDLNISRQAVSQSLKRAVTKVYQSLMDQGITSTPTETILHMREYFQVVDEEDIVQFIELFPKKIREEIREHARNYKPETN